MSLSQKGFGASIYDRNCKDMREPNKNEVQVRPQLRVIHRIVGVETYNLLSVLLLKQRRSFYDVRHQC